MYKKVFLLVFLMLAFLLLGWCYDLWEKKVSTQNNSRLVRLGEVKKEVNKKEEKETFSNREEKEIDSDKERLEIKKEKTKEVTISWELKDDIIMEGQNCSKIEIETKRDDCYFKKRECNLIEDEGKRMSCWLTLADEKKDCKIIPDEQLRKDCEMEVLLENEGIEWCKMLSWEMKDRCMSAYYINIAINEKNKKYCEKITDNFYKNYCFDSYYMTVAVENRDKRYCKYIQDKNIKIWCEAMINEREEK